MKYAISVVLILSALAWLTAFIDPAGMSLTMIRLSVGFTIFVLVLTVINTWISDD